MCYYIFVVMVEKYMLIVFFVKYCQLNIKIIKVVLGVVWIWLIVFFFIFFVWVNMEDLDLKVKF